MSDTRSTYDESNEVWPYFVLTLLSVVLIPMSVTHLAQLFGSSSARKLVSSSHASFRASKQRKDALSSTKTWVLATGWALVAALVYFVRVAASSEADDTAAAIWDPYALLEVGTSASLKEIKSAYRKLSLQFHPDKVKDVAESTKESIEAKYVEISKAYRALTDDDTRENFLLYGHPDGPQPVIHGIALPAFLFDPAGSLAFVAMYLLGFGVFVPLVVTKWWTASQVKTRRGLLQNTASQFCQLLAKEQAHFITRERILREILTSSDMDDVLGNTVSGYEDRLAKLESYLRRHVPQSTEELKIATETARLLMGLHDFAAEFKSFALCQRLLQMHRSVIQAVPFHVTIESEYAQLSGANLNAVLEKKPDQTQILDVVKNARSYFPKVHLLKAEFKVSGETDVTPNSRVFLQFKFLVLPLGDRPPELSNEEIEAVGSELTDAKQLLEPASQNKKQPQLPDAVAPYFPFDAPTRWYAYVYGDIDNKLVEKPLEISHMDLHNLKLSSAEISSGENIVIGTINVPLTSVSPPQAGSFPFKAALISSTYFGTDIKLRLSMNVVNPPASASVTDVDLDPEDEADEQKAEEEDSDEEIEGLSDIDTSTEEEDNA